MGMDVQMVGDHGLSFSSGSDLIEIVKSKLKIDFNSPTLANYLSELNITDAEKHWSFAWTFTFDPYYSTTDQHFQLDGDIPFKGPFGHHLLVGQKTFAISSPVRWKAFIENSTMQTDLRTFVFKIAKALEGKRIVYFPDNGANCSGYDQYVRMGFSLDEILNVMKSEVGDPSENLENIRNKSGKAIYDGYYIDSL